ncbi:MAG: hypothetical protein L3V56_00280 [Candidatus Magnetoovum sp. WYHC-5]|nr:hypothetical protein [Candidatus Magnetoovum sp. WYHC-5]
MALQVCFLYQDKFFTLFKEKNGILVELSGKSNRGFGKAVLIVSKELTYHAREKYPPAADKNIRAIISNDVPDLFPMLKEPTFQYKIAKKGTNFYMIDIWAFEESVLEQVKPHFNYSYVVCEELLFYSEHAELTCFRGGKFFHIVAHDKNGFLGSRTFTSMPQGSDIILFMRSLGVFGQGINKLNLYAGCLKDSIKEETKGLEVIEHNSSMPISAAGFRHLKWRQFKITSKLSHINTALILRVSLYCFIAYVVFNFYCLKGLNSTINGLEGEISKVDKEIASFAAMAAKQESKDVVEALASKFAKTPSVLYILDRFAQTLPVGVVVRKINIDGRAATVDMESASPLETIKLISLMGGVKKVELSGTPFKIGDNNYGFKINVEFAEDISSYG